MKMVVKTGTKRADLLNGGPQDDKAFGSAGSDRVTGSGGRDTLSGGEGRDTLNGGRGNDQLFGFGASDAVTGSGDITATRVAEGISGALFVTSAPGDKDRLFVVQKSGQISILDTGTGEVEEIAFLDIPSNQIGTNSERGLLGLAFHPNYEQNQKFYVYVTAVNGDLQVREYTAKGDVVEDPATYRLIISIEHPETNHNGGWIAFGPDGKLYIATGDGGGGNDPGNNAQDKGELLGKILRINVNRDDFQGDDSRNYAIPDDNPFADRPGADEIWALGLRNPWRPSFDRKTGDFYIADVGQGDREEVNFQAADSNGGENYGWRIKEGKIINPAFPDGPGPNGPTLTDPLMDYSHFGPNSGQSITGGYVYRGQSEGMRGVYFYADFVSSEIWSFRVVNGKAVDAANRTDQFVTAVGSLDNIASFGEDGRGNLYIVGIDGEIFRIDPQKGAGDMADVINGGDGNDRILGGIGNDKLRGDAGQDSINGGGQDDLINGGGGQDRLTGGTGADTFDFNQISDSRSGSKRDVIVDFDDGQDVIDLSTIDAQPGGQAFDFIGSDAFSGQGQIRVVQISGGVVVQVNTSGAGGAEMQIVLLNAQLGNLSADDFIL
jgi:glucose/arabinose dehydrogenase